MGRYLAWGLFLGLFAVVARAEPLGGYVGGGVGGGLEGPLAAAGGPGLGVEGSDESVRLVGGWELGRYVAVEATYFDAGSRRLVGILDFGFDVDFGGYSAAVLGRLPFRRFAPFVRVGALWWEEEGRLVSIAGASRYARSDESLLLGAGVGYEFQRFALRGEWERLEVADASRDQFWLSALLRF
jgi:hypothetical protein